jgi:hypothetical protein
MRVPTISLALAIPWLLAAAGTCSADTVITFNVTATLTGLFPGTLAGTVTIDETNPPLSTATITATGTGPFFGPPIVFVSGTNSQAFVFESPESPPHPS